jgi:anti-sigma factor RsiW
MSSTCSNNELLRDYAFDEIPAADRPAFERHLAACAECAAELDRLQLTTAALRILPDREPPQRIAFVSDKVYKQSRIWNLAPWFGFASAAVMAVALIADVTHRPAAEIRTVAAQTPPAAAPVQPVNEIVQRAVSEAQAEDARLFKAALTQLEKKHEQEHRNLMDLVSVMQAHQNTHLLETEQGQ